jgi:hypothetical protein
LNWDKFEEAMGGSAEAKKPMPPPEARPLGEFVVPPANDPNELLKYRFLNRGGGFLFAGPTGVGKSSLAMQLAMLWGLGKQAFDIKPARPLKSLFIQAENDEGDIAEMRYGILRGLNLTPEERDEAEKMVLVAREDSRTGLAFVQDVLRPLLEKHRADLLWIDPAFAYVGGDVSSQELVSRLLRNMINPLLREFGCGCGILHHSNKPPPNSKEKRAWQAGDLAYLGSGSIEWANWARAIIVLRSIGSHSIFEMHLAKRGARVRWKEADGETPAYMKVIAHCKEAGMIFWHEAEKSEIPTQNGSKKIYTKEDIMPHVPREKPISKEALRSKANRAGIAVNKINPMIAELIEDGRLFEWQKRRKGTNNEKLIARFAQPEEELIK